MTKEQQDLAWQCLPKEVREEIKEIYHSAFECHSCYSKVHECYSVTQDCLTKFKLLEEIFGKDNLTPDTEPSELLFVERKEVQDIIKAIKDERNSTEDKEVR